MKVTFSCGPSTKSIALSDAMSRKEIQDVLHSAFELDREVVGLANEAEVRYRRSPLEQHTHSHTHTHT